MPAEVFEHTGPNPPGLDVLSKHEVVVWKHPQHGWLKADRNGSFTPLSELDVQKLRGPALPASGAPTIPTVSTTPPTTLPQVGAGSAKANIVGGMSQQKRGDERNRAKAEATHQATMDQAKFAAPEREDPLEGLGLSQRAAVAKLVRGGMPVEDAVAEVRKKTPPAADEQAKALQQ
jgi:hypothetical protein